ncbi:bifunctional DNA primase/helicase, partial [Porphyromonas gingivalis]
IRYFFKHNAHVLWAFTTNQKTNPLAFSYVELTFFLYLSKRALRTSSLSCR